MSGPAVWWTTRGESQSDGLGPNGKTEREDAIDFAWTSGAFARLRYAEAAIKLIGDLCDTCSLAETLKADRVQDVLMTLRGNIRHADPRALANLWELAQAEGMP